MKILIANPGYTPGYVSAFAQAKAIQRHPEWEVHFYELSASLLTWNFNSAWATALNLKESHGLTHFLLIHADVRPKGEDWLDVMLAEMERMQADVMSAIIPIKDQRGLTSTALDTDPWRPLRLTQRQVLTEFPETWTADELLFNTGLLLVDLRKPWVEQVCFTMRDQIVRDDDGQWRAYVQPEDWHFSRQCRALGVRAYVTRKVVVEHFGTGCWSSGQVWGEPVDQVNGALVREKYDVAQIGAQHGKDE